MLIIFDEWKAVRRAKMSILTMLNMMRNEGASIDVKHLKDYIFMVSGEQFDVETFMQAIEDLLVMGEIKANVINTETVIITF